MAVRFVLASHVHTNTERERGGDAFNLAHLVPGLDTSRVVTRRGRKEEGWVNVRATRSVFSTRGNLNGSRWIRRQTEDGSGSVLPPPLQKLVNNRPQVLISRRWRKSIGQIFFYFYDFMYSVNTTKFKIHLSIIIFLSYLQVLLSREKFSF